MPDIAVDFRNPDYDAVFMERARRLRWIRANPGRLPALRLHYRDNPAQFLSDWAMTYDSRVASQGRSPIMPFVLFPRQVELVGWIIERWRADEPGVVVKSRDVGASWITFALACTLCLFHRDLAIGFGSAIEDKLDRSNDPDTLFAKGRAFLRYLPVEFRGGWTLEKNSQHMRLSFPATGSSLTGEAGDRVGRGGRKSIFFVDEAAHIERPLIIDASLSATTNCRIDLSSVNGTANPFATKALGGKVPRFDFTWRQDPRKDDAWYAQKCKDIDNPVIVAQEIDCSFNASVEGVIIPSLWVQAAIGAAEKLGTKPTGARRAGLDVADAGKDKNAFVARHGIEVTHASQWSGKDSDIFATTERAFALCDELGLAGFLYDADGLGAGIKGDARKVNEARATVRRPRIAATMYRGSGGVWQPDARIKGLDRTNADYYLNFKAQIWFHVRQLFRNTYNAVQGATDVDRDALISLPRNLPELLRLTTELSQPTYKMNTVGKVMVDKMPDGTASPNLADALVIAFSLGNQPFAISDAALAAFA